MAGKICFGIDVGGTTIKCGMFRTDGTVLDKWEIPTRTENGGEQILPDIAAAVHGRIQVNGFEEKQITGIGIGIPGPVRAGKVPVAVNLHWGEKDVAKELEALTGFPVRVANDANAAADPGNRTYSADTETLQIAFRRKSCCYSQRTFTGAKT